MIDARLNDDYENHRKYMRSTPLKCPKYQGMMRVINFIKDRGVIKKMLQHLGIWLVNSHSPSQIKPISTDYSIDYSDSQLQHNDDLIYIDPGYTIETYMLQS